MKKFTHEEFITHIKTNMDDKDCYSQPVIVAALYKKIYGELPKIGLSGFQGEAAELVYNKMPKKNN